MYCNVCNKYRKFENTKISCIFKKPLSLSIAYSVVINMKKYLKKKIQLKY